MIYPYSVILIECSRLKGLLWQFWSLLLKFLDCIGKPAEMEKDFEGWGDKVEITGLQHVSTVVSIEYAKDIYLVENTYI